MAISRKKPEAAKRRRLATCTERALACAVRVACAAPRSPSLRRCSARPRRRNARSRLPRTSDGQPDLQGYWTNNTVVPLERPAAYGDRAELTEEEARERLEKALQPSAAEAGTDADVHYQLTDYGLDISQNNGGVRPRTVADHGSARTAALPPPRPEVAAKPKERAAYNASTRSTARETRTLGGAASSGHTKVRRSSRSATTATSRSFSRRATRSSSRR